MLPVTGVVTAGGQSQRMGRDKAWLELGGRPMIERVIESLRPVTAGITVLANSRDYERLGWPVIADATTGIGPLEAIRSALANSPTPWLFLVGCDLPFVTTDLFARLRSFLDRAPETYAAIVPSNAAGLIEPLCALYSTQALAVVNDLIAGGGRKVSLLFERVPALFLAFDELRDLRGAELFFENINTPEEYAAALARVGQDR